MEVTHIFVPAALMLCMVASGIQGVVVEFGEDDYQAREGAGGVNIVVQKTKENYGALVLTVETVLYNETDRRPAAGNLKILPDPAEYEMDGRQDFVRTTQRVTFQPSQTQQEQNVFLKFNDDEINEANEGFLVILNLQDGAEIDPRDADNFKFKRQGVTLIRITDDDPIQLAFERPSYTVSETDGAQNQLINIIKVDNRLTEQEIDVFAELSTSSARSAAQNGVDFRITQQKSITLYPDQQSKYIPFEVLDDEVPEEIEFFELALAIPQQRTVKYSFAQPDAAIVSIEDNDEPTTEPPVNPCDVCGANSHCVWVSLGSKCEFKYGRKVCTEQFDSRCMCNYGFTGNGIVCEDIDECALGTDNCGNNANCINTVGSFRCECQPGFTGNGLVCRDINECQRGTHNCTLLQVCRNIIGGFQCIIQNPPTQPPPPPTRPCPRGFRRTRGICININECAEGTDNCDTNANCEDRIGFFRCTCRRGFTGNGRTCTRIQSQPRPQPPTVTQPDETGCDDSTPRTRSHSRGTRSRPRCGTPRSRSGTSRGTRNSRRS